MQWCCQLLYTHPDLVCRNQSRNSTVRSSVQSTAKLQLLPSSTVKGLPSMDAHTDQGLRTWQLFQTSLQFFEVFKRCPTIPLHRWCKRNLWPASIQLSNSCQLESFSLILPQPNSGSSFYLTVSFKQMWKQAEQSDSFPEGDLFPTSQLPLPCLPVSWEVNLSTLSAYINHH